MQAWRYEDGALKPESAASLASLMEMTDRDSYEAPMEYDDVAKHGAEASKQAEVDVSI